MSLQSGLVSGAVGDPVQSVPVLDAGAHALEGLCFWVAPNVPYGSGEVRAMRCPRFMGKTAAEELADVFLERLVSPFAWSAGGHG